MSDDVAARAADSESGQPWPAPAALWKRVGALIIDWFAALAINAGFLNGHPMATLAVFALMTWILLGTLGSTIGHTIFGIGVRDHAGRLPGPKKALIRTVLLCLVVPAVISDGRGRGTHDVAAGTAITATRA